MELSPSGDERAFDTHGWESDAFSSTFEGTTSSSLEGDASLSSTPAPPPVPEPVPLPGLIWLLLAGTGLGAYSLRRTS